MGGPPGGSGVKLKGQWVGSWFFFIEKTSYLWITPESRVKGKSSGNSPAVVWQTLYLEDNPRLRLRSATLERF